MNISRRDLLFAGGLSLLAGTVVPRAQSQNPSATSRLLDALQGNRLPLTMTDAPAGRGWDWLVGEARDARFTLIGEEHGVAETAQLSAALFKALRGSGYTRMAIELSPIIAQDIEAAARRNGLQGVMDFFAAPDTWSPLYLREEAQFLAAVVNAAPKNERVLWGLDREIFGRRHTHHPWAEPVTRISAPPADRLSLRAAQGCSRPAVLPSATPP
jgi:erythromycin esterase-like protein